MAGVEPVGEVPVDEAPMGLYTKVRKTRTFEMDVMQKIVIGKFSNLAHVVFTNGCLYQYHYISDIWATTNNVQTYDHISWIDPQIRWGCYMTSFKLG